MRCCFLFSIPKSKSVVYTGKSFCSSSSYLILLMHISGSSLGEWKKNKTSRTAIKVQINNL
ncbi:hypothetical protein COJ45_05370 [Bacillus cereus]|nr:hypothetical protein COJ45_05370 [Bacillus cereus]